MLAKHLSKQNKVYNFHPETKEFLFESNATLDPLETKKLGENVYIRPAFSTFVKPLKTKKNQVMVFDIENYKWIAKKDFRRTEYYDKNGEKHIITNIDEIVPKDAILEPMPTNFITKPKYENGKWVESGLIYKGIEVKTKKDVDDITKSLIRGSSEEKAKTEKLLAGNNECKIWNEFIEARALIIKEGNTFIKENNLEEV